MCLYQFKLLAPKSIHKLATYSGGWRRRLAVFPTFNALAMTAFDPAISPALLSDSDNTGGSGVQMFAWDVHWPVAGEFGEPSSDDPDYIITMAQSCFGHAGDRLPSTARLTS